MSSTPPAERRDPPAPVFSVIVPVRDDTERLLRCVEALRSQTFPADQTEVVVVDNASDVPVAGALPALPGWLAVDVESSGGSYAARNRGLSRARGRFLAFTDADCVPRPDWLSSAWDALAALGPGTVLAGRVAVFAAQEPPTAAERYEQRFAFPQESYVRRAHFGVTANLVIPAHVMRAVGPFRADLHSGGDLEWGQRCVAAGYALEYRPEMVIEHPARRSLAQLAQKSRRVVRGAARAHDWRLRWVARFVVRQSWFLLKAVVQAARADEPTLRARLELVGVTVFVRLMHIVALGEALRTRS